MTSLWRQLWVEVDESEDLRYDREQTEQLERELEELRETVDNQKELLLQREQEIEELKQGRNQRRKRWHHSHGLRSSSGSRWPPLEEPWSKARPTTPAPSMGVPPPRTPVGPPPEHVRNDPSRQWPPPSTPSSPTNVTVRSMMPPCPTEQHRVAASPTAAAHGGGARNWLHAVRL